MTKTRKSILKRMKITKSGRFYKSGSGINHFQAKASRSKQLKKKGYSEMSKIQSEMLKSYLYRK